MTDPIIEELWEIKDGIARESGYDIDALITLLQARGKARTREILDLSMHNKSSEQAHTMDEAKRAWRDL